MKGLKIVSTGRALPAKVVTNDDMSKLVETSDEWIATRTGIRTRHFCEGEKQSDLAEQAARRALEHGKVDPTKRGWPRRKSGPASWPPSPPTTPLQPAPACCSSGWAFPRTSPALT